MEPFQFIPHYLFKGGDHHCNICGFNGLFYLKRGSDNPVLSQYQVMGAGRRAVNCIKCGSSDRDRLVFCFFEKHKLTLTQKWAFPIELLHLAPEYSLSKRLEEILPASITRVDKRASGYRWTYNKKVIHADIRLLPFADHHFHVIICNHVLEHVIEDGVALNELFRVLKPGGLGILQVPLALGLNKTLEASESWTKEERVVKLGQWDHVRLYGLDYFEKLSNHGFQTSRWHPTDELILKYRLDPKEFLIVVEKP